MVALGLKIAVLDLSLILFIKSELLCRRFPPLNNFKTPTKDITLYNIFVSTFCWLLLSLLWFAFSASGSTFLLSLNFLFIRGYYISTQVETFLTRVYLGWKFPYNQSLRIKTIPADIYLFQVNNRKLEQGLTHVDLFEKTIVENGSRTIAPEENCPTDNCPWIIVPQIIAPENNCHRGKLSPGKLPPHYKLPPKIITPTQINSPQRVLRVNWGKLCIVYEYYN